jgi:hypothetical protein
VTIAERGAKGKLPAMRDRSGQRESFYGTSAGGIACRGVLAGEKYGWGGTGADSG